MKILLNGNWKLRSVFLKKELNVYVPGSIYNDLLTHQLLEDPYYRDNEKRTNECLKYSYIYSKTFTITEEMLEKRIYLVFEGIDTVSTISINETKVMDTFNMHRRYRIYANDFLKIGENTLFVELKPVIDYMNEEAKKCQYDYMQIRDAMHNYIFVRKAHSMFGWDWGPQLPDSGIFRDVYLEVLKTNAIRDVEVVQDTNLSLSKLTIKIKNEIISQSKTKVELYENSKVIFESTQETKELNVFNIEIKNPKLWNPVGYGEQFLYLLKVTNEEGNVTCDKQLKIGLRKMEILTIPDEYGTSFTACVNGQKIFVKGGNYIIEDNILPRTNYDRTKRLLMECVKCHHNGLRVWGGGLYPADYFYEICDELGLLVWQDLMFACSYYDTDNKVFMDEIKEEIIDNVTRIRNHPSLMLICGNNENETAVNWNPPNKERSMKNYLYQYEEYIPNILKNVAPYIFYWPSSPSSGGGFDNPNDDSRGDMHYWGVWHNIEPIENYRTYFPRFMSEYGLQSFPEMKTIKTFTIPEDLNIYSYVMECHQKNGDANSKIMNYISKMFKFPNSFPSLIYLSQVIQAEGVRYCVEHMRRNYGRCMGSFYWQINDCWPVASWSSIDYYGRYKALQYESKRFYNPILLSIEENRKTSTYNIFITNETNKDINGIINIRIFTLNGYKLMEKEINCQVSSYSSKNVYSDVLDKTFEEKQNLVVVATLLVDKKNISENCVNFVPDKYLNFHKPEIKYCLLKNNDEYQIKLNSKYVCKYVKIEVEKDDIIFSDNFFNLYPNEERIITFKSNIDLLEKDIEITSLFDSY